jgi:hypothetical protein
LGVIVEGSYLFHGFLDALEQVPRPGDVARHGRQVPRDGRVRLVLLVQLLHLLQLLAVVLEDDVQLRVQVALEALSLQDALKLAQQLQRVLDGGDVLEAQVDEVLQRRLQVRYLT